MSELLLKYHQLDFFAQKEVIDFVDFLLSKKKVRTIIDNTSYQKQLLKVSVWSDKDLQVFDETKKHFEELRA